MPVALLALARARAASGQDGAEEALEEAAQLARERGALSMLDAIEEERGNKATATG